MLLECMPTLQHAEWRHLDPEMLSTDALLPALRTLHVEEVSDSSDGPGCALLPAVLLSALEALMLVRRGAALHRGTVIREHRGARAHRAVVLACAYPRSIVGTTRNTRPPRPRQSTGTHSDVL
ncbi:hypothetical protein EDB84DRAFT_1563521 [Lactarius hengduanensis]|nr:hypothetical protein EDB84DRAFT_1563521 [Lactarius hengduanensis]